MAQMQRLTLGPGGSSGFGSDEFRNAINGVQAPGFVEDASKALLSPRAVADTGIVPQSGAGVGTFAAARNEITPKADTVRSTDTSGNVGVPLGGLLDQMAQNLVKGITSPFKRGFIDEDGINRRAAMLTQQALEALPIDVDAQGMEHIQANAMKIAKAEAKQQNREAFGAVVGSSLFGNAVDAGVALNAHDNAIDAQVKQMQIDTERAINSIHFNERQRKIASNIVHMKQNLRTVDSILTQAEPALAGQQRQMFLRDDVSRRRV